MAGRRPALDTAADGSASPRVALPGTLLGIGLGAFADGILLHQILQWHHMMSAVESPRTLPGLERNTLWDGWFHASAWLVVVTALVLLWSRLRSGYEPGSSSRLCGSMLFGWGLFNVGEGVVDHHILRIHHVRDDLGGPLSWDLGFLALNAALIVAGWLWQRSAAR